MISAFANSLKIPELRQRILFTLAIIVIVRLGAAIPLPGVNSIGLTEWARASAASGGEGAGAAAVNAMANIFSGGALTNCAIFALGIMPYISASIMIQLMTAVVPQLQKLSREDGGRQKITQLTRYITIVLAVVQGGLLIHSLTNGTNPFLSNYDSQTYGPLILGDAGFGYYAVGLTTIVAGTMLLMWLGEQVTERGIGNGVSLIITVNIIQALPSAIFMVWDKYVTADVSVNPFYPAIAVLLIAFMALVIAGTVAITEGQRRIPIQYAKRVVGRKVLGGQKQYMPLKINYSGVMPIIFATAIISIPSFIIGFLFPDNATMQNWARYMSDGTHPAYYVVGGLLIFFFSYFWVAVMFQPAQIADDLKRNGGYIPGVRPGQPTEKFFDFTMSRLTFAGSIFLTAMFVIPGLVSSAFGISPMAAQFFGGTSLLILVGVLLDILRQVETHLIQRNYEGFLRKGKIRGRNAVSGGGAGGGGATTAASGNTLVYLWVVIAVLVILGVVALIGTGNAF
ncbi:preprotein translocase subunit SecY [Sulfuriroseicoccus oceanibius]|uniref:Protein translocase subunit SecY n=1 Tax=Sulfuriroseicoccus oceanibius TaxID=2707525 RepID=A0A6B3L541_9BACT|nr:preprotein translocase subunit SecY [Sulfuriroseicoccus oceanibius]QQL45839.1 preprotein translocase subunit SecY [Sulfuriroseicoccus oceanibius]